MCGIAGIVALPGGEPPSRERVAEMCRSIVHRGPDEEGIHVAGGVALGLRRLSIIDVEGGHQPILNEDGSIQAVFNGEIYNFRELRRELETRGHVLRSRSDAEVIVHLFEELGSGLASRLNGMFAIAIHDSRHRRLVLIRDRLGIKPLFFALTSGHLVFGSEIKAILASGLVERRLDLEGLRQFIAWEYVSAPRTLFDGVRKLPPAHLMEVDLATGRIHTSAYWDVPVGPSAEISDREWEEAVDGRVKQAVERQLVSDVPLGALLSGGVDSSLVVSHMGEALAFSIGFEDPTYDESRWAKRVAAHLEVRHRLEILRPDVQDLFQHLMGFMEDPIGDFSIFPTYLVCQVARQEVKVVLSGDGGDELFGGYETYVAQQKAAAWNRLPAALRSSLLAPLIERLPPGRAKKGLVNKAKRFVEGAGYDPGLGHARWRLFAGEVLQGTLFTPEAAADFSGSVGGHITALAQAAGPRSEVDRGLYVDTKSYLVDNCLVKLDRMSMACSLEARVPLLDHEVVELAFQVPARLKVARGRSKILLRRVAARHVPRDCIYRPKEGFSIPIKQWLGGELRPLMEDLLDCGSLAAEGLLQPATVARLKAEHLQGRANHSHVLWALMVFQDWRRRWGA